MPQNQGEIRFPAKQPFKEMGKLLDGRTVRQLQVRNRKEAVLVDLPVEFNLRNFIPRVLTAPTKAVGVGISTIARLLGVRVVIDHNGERRKPK
jgi:hypothetical protein